MATAERTEFEVSGTQFEGRIGTIEGVRTGDAVVLEREPDNAYDCLAVHLRTAGGDSLGYMPGEIARELSPLLDAGRLRVAVARVKDVTPLSQRSRKAKKPLLTVELEYEVLARPARKAVARPARWRFASNTGGTAFAIAEDGSLWARGYNGSGGCGCGDLDEHEELVPVAEPGPWAKAYSSFGRSYGLKEDGSVWAWGDNEFGDLATAAKKPVQAVPVRMVGDAGWKDLGLQSAAWATPVLLREDGSLWWMGSLPGHAGPGGAPSRSSHLSPVRLGTDDDWDAVWSGDDFSFARKQDGTVWSWGTSWDGALGLGKAREADVPTLLGDRSDWVKLAPGYHFVIGLRADGSLWAWGNNEWWQLGLGGYASDDADDDQNDRPRRRPVPIAVPGTTFTDIAVGDQMAVAVDTDGRLWTWGHSPCDVDWRSVVRISEPGHYDRGDTGGWKSVQNGCFAIREDGSLWECPPNVWDEAEPVRVA